LGTSNRTKLSERKAKERNIVVPGHPFLLNYNKLELTLIAIPSFKVLARGSFKVL